MSQNIIAFRGEDEQLEHFPPLSSEIVNKILLREKDIADKQKEIYDILIQSGEQKNDEDKVGYYQRAHSKNPQYMRYLFNMYHNTDIQDLQELLINMPHLLSELGARKAYINIKSENNNKKIGNREDLKPWLLHYISKSFIESLELKIIELGRNNIFEISFSLQQDGVKLWISTVADFDGDTLEKTKEGSVDPNAFAFAYYVKLETSNDIVRFIRKLAGKQGDIKDLIVFD